MKLQKQYKCDDGRIVNVEDVILKNKPIIEAHSYFGTEEGDKNIREFLVFCGFQEREFSVSHNKEIINKSSLVKEECEKLGLDYNENIYVIIREFNMPQLSLLPRGTVGKADRVVTLLVRKD